MDTIKLIIEGNRFVDVNNPFGEKSRDYICENIFNFESGKIYGVICEHGGGGEAISLLLSGKESLKREKVYIDEIEAKVSDIEEMGWYVGNPLYFKGFKKRELSAQKALQYAIKKYSRYTKIEDVIEDFHLSSDKLHYGISRNCEWERWRISLAIGYASNKKVFCFPWMDTLHFYDCLYNSSVFRFFRKMTAEGAIFILPTSREENVRDFVDCIIRISNPRFERNIAECPYFQENF